MHEEMSNVDLKNPNRFRKNGVLEVNSAAISLSLGQD